MDPELVLPFTGEIVDLHDPAQVAHALDQVRDAKRRLDELRSPARGAAPRRVAAAGHEDDPPGRRLTAVVSGGTRVV